MLEQIKQRIEDLTPSHGDLIAASEYVKACRYLIGEVEHLRTLLDIENKAFKEDHFKVEELQKALTIVNINLERRKNDDMTLWSLWDISQKALERSESK